VSGAPKLFASSTWSLLRPHTCPVLPLVHPLPCPCCPWSRVSPWGKVSPEIQSQGEGREGKVGWGRQQVAC
jgi:hypothetical protein